MKNADSIIEIRMATVHDAADISALLYESFLESQSLYTEKAFAATTPGEEEVADRINQKIVWLATYNNRNAGTVSAWPQLPGLHIRSLAVRPFARGKGVAAALMTHVENLAASQGYHFLTLTTTHFLLDAIKLYDSFGFERTGFRDLHGTQLIQMKKSLASIIKNKNEKNDYAK